MTTDELKQGTIDTLLRIADRFGVPCVVLAVVMYFGREAAIAIHSSVVEPDSTVTGMSANIGSRHNGKWHMR